MPNLSSCEKIKIGKLSDANNQAANLVPDWKFKKNSSIFLLSINCQHTINPMHISNPSTWECCPSHRSMLYSHSSPRSSDCTNSFEFWSHLKHNIQFYERTNTPVESEQSFFYVPSMHWKRDVILKAGFDGVSLMALNFRARSFDRKVFSIETILLVRTLSLSMQWLIISHCRVQNDGSISAIEIGHRDKANEFIGVNLRRLAAYPCWSPSSWWKLRKLPWFGGAEKNWSAWPACA